MLDTQVRWLPVEQIAPNPHQPRREFAPGPLAELAESIRRHGIIQPLTVRHSADGWELIAGERRLRAAKLAGLQTVPCLEMQVDEQDSAILALIENIQRRDLHYSGGSRRHRRLSPSIRLHAGGSRRPAGPLPFRSGQ
ncbi:MAG: ParB/RepB/Spo0J family partition protein [Dysosmobacter sp.]